MKEGGECGRHKAGLEPHEVVIDVPFHTTCRYKVQGTRDKGKAIQTNEGRVVDP